jgi:DNA-binding GntR family transcriptional regulator
MSTHASPDGEPSGSAGSRTLRPVGTRSTVDQVAAEIRRALLVGDLPPGEEFSMVDLSAQLQVSHIPVREALRRLEAHGLLTLRPGRRAIVAPIDAKQLEDVHRLWILICEDVAARACVRYTDEDIDRAEATLNAFTSLPQDSDQAFEGHQRFHMELLEPGASEWDTRLLDMLCMAIERAARAAYHRSDPAEAQQRSGERAYAEHRPLLDAARARDVMRLRREIRDHHERHLGRLVARLTGDAEASA